MIVSMKKVSLLCLAGDTARTLDAVRELGVLHLRPVKTPEGDDLESARNAAETTRSALNVLQASAADANTAPLAAVDEAPEQIVKHVHDLETSRKALLDRADTLDAERASLAPFGHADPALLQRLDDQGISVRVFRVTGKTLPPPPEGAQTALLLRKTDACVVAVAGLGDFDYPGIELPRPSRSLAEVEQEYTAVQEDLRQVTRVLQAMTSSVGTLAALCAEQEEQVRYIEAREGMGSHERLAYLEGFCPAPDVERLRSEAARQGWGLVVRDPVEGEEVPTLVSMPRWVNPIRPMFEFLGIVPGYRETDVSSAFLVFLSVFFAMIVGDAGYGALIFLFTHIGRRKRPDAPPAAFRLLYVFSVCTLAWGILTANYFGISYTMLPAFLRVLRVDWLMDRDNSMTFCLLLGAVHLSIAHAWNALRVLNSPKAPAQAGWIFVTWFMFAGARSLLLGTAFPAWLYAVLGVGLAGIVGSVILQREWMGFALLPQDIIASFGDLVSYLRLFALGIASVKVAEAFNSMAGDVLVVLLGPFVGGSVVGLAVGLLLGFIVAGLVVVAGHGLNIVLCAMSVLVHGVRLNALEFSLHMGQEWSGFEYRPFARNARGAEPAV